MNIHPLYTIGLVPLLLFIYHMLMIPQRKNGNVHRMKATGYGTWTISILGIATGYLESITWLFVACSALSSVLIVLSVDAIGSTLGIHK